MIIVMPNSKWTLNYCSHRSRNWGIIWPLNGNWSTNLSVSWTTDFYSLWYT
jgi:hypothetical protein